MTSTLIDNKETTWSYPRLYVSNDGTVCLVRAKGKIGIALHTPKDSRWFLGENITDVEETITAVEENQWYRFTGKLSLSNS